jgi:hypothetical protein
MLAFSTIFHYLEQTSNINIVLKNIPQKSALHVAPQLSHNYNIQVIIMN